VGIGGVWIFLFYEAQEPVGKAGEFTSITVTCGFSSIDNWSFSVLVLL
jgi:hypothetical protein